MKTGMLVAALLAATPAAHAQGDVCGALTRVIDEAPSSFEALQDTENFEDNYEPFFYVGDAYSCEIDVSDGALFSCWWQFDAPAQASAKFDQLDTLMKPCLDGWSRTDLSGKASAKSRPIARGALYDGAASPKVYVEVFTEPPKDRGSPSVTLNVAVR